MSWYLDGREIRGVHDFAVEPYGFVYEITQLSTGRKYIGKKKLRTGKYRLQSDWMDYYGSSKEVKRLVKKNGPLDFRRKILFLASDSRTLSICENVVLVRKKVLERTKYFNKNIGGKLFSSF